MTERLNGIAQYVLDAVAGPFVVDDIAVDLEARVGVVAATADETSAEELLRRAEAVHTASAHRINISTSPRTDRFSVSREDLHLISDLRTAIPAGELELYYQPVVSTRPAPTCGEHPDGAPTLSVEALVRWNHPTRGLLQPGQFIALAENSILISPLTRWVLAEAVRQNRIWSGAGLDVRVAVNVSPRVLIDDDVVAMVRDVLAATGCSPSHLKIEITESAIVADPQRARDTVATLRGLGVGVSIDDFGTGFTSLDLLRALEISEVKLDRTFVGTATTVPADLAIVTTVVDLTRRLGIDAVAEGVEDEPTELLLRELGYDYLQGYLFSRPLPAPHATQWLAALSRDATRPVLAG
ncbi:MAG: putative bifunctional diguanylate cyclase/phosphodiesterase [Janthinobacterium lividum]